MPTINKKIHAIYGLNYQHEVPQNWESYKVTVMQKSKTDCTEEEFLRVQQFLAII